MNADRHANRVATGVRVFCALALLSVGARVAQLQMLPSSDLRAAINARTSESEIAPVRGDLLDRRGRVLASTRVGYRVVIDPVAAGDQIDRVIVALSAQLGTRADDLGSRVIRVVVENQRRRDAGLTGPGDPGLANAMAAAGIGTPADANPGADAHGGGFAGTVRGWLAGAGLIKHRPQENSNRGLIRYIPVSGVLTKDEADAVRDLKLRGVFVERRSVREIMAGSSLAPLVGKVGYEDNSTDRIGRMGAEKLYQDRLEGDPGMLRYVRDALGRPLWVERGAWNDADGGVDIRLSMDAEIQRIAAQELERGILDANAAGGRAIVLDPHTGEILAMVDLMRDVPGTVEVPWHDPKSGLPRPQMPEGVRFKVLRDDPARDIEPVLARNRCVEDVYEPGSTFKPFVWAAAHELGRLKEGEMVRTETKAIRTWYNRRIEDVTFRKEMTWDDVLRYSSNIGMYNVTERLTHNELRDTVLSLGFGAKTGLGIPGESAGIVTSRRDWTKYTQTSVGMGYEVSATMVQMVRAFSVFARNGDDAGTLPGVRLTAAGQSDTRPGMIGGEVFVERVFDPETALAVREPLREVVNAMERARMRNYPDDVPARYSMFGKSGTAYIACTPPPGMERPRGAGGYFKQYTSSFLVATPLENPELVILVVIDDPDPALRATLRHFGSQVAGPVVRRVAERALRYLGVPVTPQADATQAR